MPTIIDGELTLSPELEKKRIVSLPEAGRLLGVSVDTIKRNHRKKIIKLSARRLGMRLEDALQLRKAP